MLSLSQKMGTMVTQEVQRRQTLSPTDARLLTTLSSQGQNIFTTQDAASVLGCSSAAVRKRLHRLVKKGWLRRLEKGKYLILPLSAGPAGEYMPDEFVIAAHLIEPYYISYWSALRYYGYSEQAAPVVYVVTTRRKRLLTVEGITYRFVTVRPHKFFGSRRVWSGAEAILMAEREKALVDSLDRLDLCGGVIEAAKAIWRGRDEMNWEKVVAYGRRMGNRTILKRLGFLLETLALGTPSVLDALQANVGAGYTVLDNLYPREGRRDHRWHLVVNVPEHELLNWREH